jgi:malic enzyme
MSITITDEMVEAATSAVADERWDCSTMCGSVRYCPCRSFARAALSAVAPLIEAAVRERCAAIAESHMYGFSPMLAVGKAGVGNARAAEIAAAIRADGGAE